MSKGFYSIDTLELWVSIGENFENRTNRNVYIAVALSHYGYAPYNRYLPKFFIARRILT